MLTVNILTQTNLQSFVFTNGRIDIVNESNSWLRNIVYTGQVTLKIWGNLVWWNICPSVEWLLQKVIFNVSGLEKNFVKFAIDTHLMEDALADATPDLISLIGQDQQYLRRTHSVRTDWVLQVLGWGRTIKNGVPSVSSQSSSELHHNTCSAFGLKNVVNRSTCNKPACMPGLN